MIPAERLYLVDDPALGIRAEQDQAVIDRHVRRYWEAIHLARRTGGRWLDFACGSGYGTRIIADTAVADLAMGVDIDPCAIGHAIRYYQTDTCRFGTGIPDYHPWDVIVSIETLEHLPQASQRRIVGSLAALLDKAGTLVVACPIGRGPNPNNPHHLHEPTKLELRMLLEPHFGFVGLALEHYQSTSGPAVQAWAVCREPRA